jgi:hypothetical protein
MAVYKIDGFGTRNQTDGSGFDANKERRQRFVQMYATGTIAKGDAVCLDVNATEPANGWGNHVMEADLSAPATSCAIGIATAAASAGDLVEIQVAGYCDFAQTVFLSAAPGDPLGAHANAGELAVMAAHLNLAVAIHIADDPAAVGTGTGTAISAVFLLNPLNL